jgi:hypothetical protein
VEEDDGFVTITSEKEQQQSSSLPDGRLRHNKSFPSQTDLFDPQQHQDDSASVISSSHKRDYERSPSSDKRNNSTGGPLSTATDLLGSYTTSVFGYFNKKNAQHLMDYTLDGIQKMKTYSHELLSQEATNAPTTDNVASSVDPSSVSSKISSPEGGGMRKTVTTTSSVQSSSVTVHIDKKVVRPLFQAKISKDFKEIKAILKYVVQNKVVAVSIVRLHKNLSRTKVPIITRLTDNHKFPTTPMLKTIE